MNSDRAMRGGGILKLPAPLRRDLLVLIAVKLAVLAALYALFFSPAHRPAIDALSHIAGIRHDR